MKVVIFGANGFVGKNVQNVLAGDGIEIVPASRSNGIDLRDPNGVEIFLNIHKPQYIVNCAAHVGSLNYVTEQAATIITDNSRMILGMYEAIAKSCPKSIVINPIANCAYPAKLDTFKEDSWWDGHLHRSVLSYGATRRLMWATSECYEMQHGIRTISLLVPNMYGPHDSSDPNKAHALNALVSKFVKVKRINETSLDIWGTGVAIREWLYAEDFGRIVSDIIRNPDMLGLNEPINIGQNFGLSVKELIAIIKRHCDYQVGIEYNPGMPDGAPKKVMDDCKFRKVFPNFEFTDFNDGVRQTIEYYESIYPY